MWKDDIKAYFVRKTKGLGVKCCEAKLLKYYVLV